jgi:periplasmic protein TonB
MTASPSLPQDSHPIDAENEATPAEPGFLLPPPGIQMWHLLATALSMSALLAVGVYFLRQAPIGPLMQPSGAIVQVEVLQPPAPVQPQVAAGEDQPYPSRPPEPPVTDHVVAPPAHPTPAARTAPPLAKLTISARKAVASDFAPPPAIATEFQAQLLAHVERYRRYPDEARHDRLHGVVHLLFTMTRDGNLRGVWVQTSSGYPILDKEAVDTIRRALPLPPIPPQLPDILSILLPVEFSAPDEAPGG